MRVVARTPPCHPRCSYRGERNGREWRRRASLSCPPQNPLPLFSWLLLVLRTNAPLTCAPYHPHGELNRTDTYTCTHTLKSARAILHECTRSLVHVYREATKFVHFADAAFLSTATKRGDALFSLGHYVHASPQNAVLESFCEGYFDSER